MRRPFSTEGRSPGEDSAIVEAAAVRVLARREHSVEELRRKLLTKGYAAASVEAVLQKLAGKRLVSDQRFTASFVHHHAKRGQGPVRIRAELRQQGISEQQIELELQGSEIEWKVLAGEVRRRKFGAAPPRTLSERAKQARFLQYRGFDAEQIRAAFQDDRGGDPDVSFDAEPAEPADPTRSGSSRPRSGGADPDSNA